MHGDKASSIECLEKRLMLNVSAPAILQLFESTYGNSEDRAADIFSVRLRWRLDAANR